MQTIGMHYSALSEQFNREEDPINERIVGLKGKQKLR